MGDKGKKPRSDAKTSVVKQRKKPDAGEAGNGGGEGNGTTKQCWPFTLVDVQPPARKAKEGDRVRGTQNGARIAVLGAGTLGFAPARESEEMIAALRETGKSLTGEITSVGKAGADIGVELCLT